MPTNTECDILQRDRQTDYERKRTRKRSKEETESEVLKSWMKLQHGFGMAQTDACRSSQLRCCLHHRKASLTSSGEAFLEQRRGVGRVPISSVSG